MEQQRIPMRGAVDLSALRPDPRQNAQRPADPGSGPAAGGGEPGAVAASGAYVVEVTEADFQAQVLERSMTVPVVIDFWAEWCEPCKQLTPILEKLATEYAGRFVLAAVDVDANQRLAQAVQVQSIPTIIGVIKGQPVPLFQGALPEQQVRAYIDELLKVAAANGVSGVAEPGGSPAAEAPQESAEPPHDPRYDEAYDAIDKGDFEAAAAAYQKILDESPADPDAKAGLAQVQLLVRTSGADPAQVRQAAADAPGDVEAQIAAADLDLVGGHVEDAFVRLIDTVRVTSGAERDAARAHLLALFEVVGGEDDRVRRARAALASALF